MDSARSKHARRRPIVEALETRELLSTIEVTTLRPNGAGSLRQTIVASNASPGPDTIDFAVSGMIRTGRRSLPTITGTVNIDGTSAPGFAGTPVVTVNFVGSRGLRFAAGSDGSLLHSLSLVRAGGAGVTLAASNITVQGNFIGLMADWHDPRRQPRRRHPDQSPRRTATSSARSTRSRASPTTTPTPSRMQPVTGWQGIRNAIQSPASTSSPGPRDATGCSTSGPISGVGGTSYAVNYPGDQPRASTAPTSSAATSSAWSAATRPATARSTASSSRGHSPICRMRPTTGRSTTPSPSITYVHSTMGGLAVGNADGRGNHRPAPATPSSTTSRRTRFTDIVYPGSTTHHGLRHLVQRRYELHDLRRLQHRPASPGPPARATWSTTTPRPDSSATGRRSPARTARPARTSSPISRESAAPSRAFTRSPPT